MNKYQNIAFGAFGLLALSVMIASTYGLTGLTIAAIFMLMVAMLTLKTIWRCIYLCIQAVSSIVSGIGHLVGIIGDEASDWSKARRLRLSAQLSTPDVAPRNVPGWDSPELVTAGYVTPGSSDELDVPSFMTDALDRQNP